MLNNREGNAMTNRVTKAVELIYAMDTDELNQIVEAVKLKRTHLARTVTRSVMVGDTVTFEARGRTVVGKVTKVNTKTLAVREDRGGVAATNWKVTASLVQKVEA
jgi:putative ribosome biogenesis GTPase RsgA